MIDLSDIPLEERERNSVTRGGKVDVHSSERTAQKQRELNTLMVVYSTPSDIPSTPREPHDAHSGEVVAEQRFGSPPPAFRVNPRPSLCVDFLADAFCFRNERLSVWEDRLISSLRNTIRQQRHRHQFPISPPFCRPSRRARCSHTRILNRRSSKWVQQAQQVIWRRFLHNMR